MNYKELQAYNEHLLRLIVNVYQTMGGYHARAFLILEEINAFMDEAEEKEREEER